jgi:predicted nucleic acid-binding Zn ribbon protein
VIGSLGLSKSYNGWLVVTRWPEIVGEQLAKRAKAVRFDDGILFVVVEDAAWRQNLSMEIDNIMTAIRSYPFGKAVKQVRLIGTERGHT